MSMFVGLCNKGDAAHSVTSNPSGSWNRSRGTCGYWAAGAWPACVGGGPKACCGATAVSISTRIAFSSERADRRINLPSVISSRSAAGRLRRGQSSRNPFLCPTLYGAIRSGPTLARPSSLRNQSSRTLRRQKRSEPPSCRRSRASTSQPHRQRSPGSRTSSSTRGSPCRQLRP